MKVDKEALKWIEANMVFPFEGHLKSDNKLLVMLHERITSHTREKFNELVRILDGNK